MGGRRVELCFWPKSFRDPAFEGKSEMQFLGSKVLLGCLLKTLHWSVKLCEFFYIAVTKKQDYSRMKNGAG